MDICCGHSSPVAAAQLQKYPAAVRWYLSPSSSRASSASLCSLVPTSALLTDDVPGALPSRASSPALAGCSSLAFPSSRSTRSLSSLVPRPAPCSARRVVPARFPPRRTPLQAPARFLLPCRISLVLCAGRRSDLRTRLPRYLPSSLLVGVLFSSRLPRPLPITFLARPSSLCLAEPFFHGGRSLLGPAWALVVGLARPCFLCPVVVI